MSVLKLVDVVDIGIEKEKARRDFYEQVSRQFDDGELRDLFQKLRDWEAAHIRKFESIRSTLESRQIAESYPEEMQHYINALVDDRLYREVSGDEFAKNVKDPVQAIQYGIGFEKDAILLFMELARYVQESNKDVIEKLMDEERQHVVSLLKLRKKYTVSKS
ncbi:MAG TPA: hypothetical protein ENN03_03355 [bacterium]|nr:hypothetical protein [bacterium]